MKRESKQQPKREIEIRCGIDGRAVTLKELLAEVVRCGGIAPKGRK